MDRIPYIFEIDSFELMPGVPPSEENLRPLWEHLCRETATCAYKVGDERHCIKFEQTSCFLSVLVEAENPQGRKLMARGTFDLTLNGFAKALPWAKDIADKIKNGDFCQWCCESTPVLKARARPLPTCADCCLEVALGVKKARRE